MSVLFSFQNCSLISHEQFINQTYNAVVSNDNEHFEYKINPDLFDLNVPYRYKTSDETQSKKRQRKIINKTKELIAEEYRDEYELVERIKLKTAEFIRECHKQQLLHTFGNHVSKLTNDRLKQCLSHWQSVERSYPNNLTGGNDSNTPVIIELDGIKYIVPINCMFSIADIQSIHDIAPENGDYSMIVLDPPWWNRYIRRSRKFNRENGYQMLSNDSIVNIPIERATQPNRTLVAIWCTNAPSLIKAVKETFLPKWKLKLVATWFWIKITKYGEPICEFDMPLKKQPFERIFIACHEDTSYDFKIPNEKMVFSVPSAIHSHKPPLQDLLKPYIKGSNCDISSLELFARYLLPNCVSIGLEAIKLQNLQLFNAIRVEKNVK